MNLKTKNVPAKIISKTDLATMEDRAKEFTKVTIKTLPTLNKKELEVLDNQVTASEEDIVCFLKRMEQKMNTKIKRK